MISSSKTHYTVLDNKLFYEFTLTLQPEQLWIVFKTFILVIPRYKSNSVASSSVFITATQLLIKATFTIKAQCIVIYLVGTYLISGEEKLMNKLM